MTDPSQPPPEAAHSIDSARTTTTAEETLADEMPSPTSMGIYRAILGRAPRIEPDAFPDGALREFERTVAEMPVIGPIASHDRRQRLASWARKLTGDALRRLDEARVRLAEVPGNAGSRRRNRAA